MDFATGINSTRLLAGLRARLDAAKAAGGEAADERPLAPFPSRPESPPAVAVAGDSEGTMDVAAEEMEEEMECGPSDSTVALLFEDDVGSDIYVGMDTDPTNAPLLPMPTAVPPPPLGSCERRHYRFHVAEGVHEHCLSGSGQRVATSLAGALERFEFQPPGRVAREMCLADVPPMGDQVCCVQLGDTAVLDYHPGDVRAAEPQERLPLAVRLAVRSMLEEAGLDGVEEEGLYVALWRSSADAWLPSHGRRPLTPPTLGSHAILVALHPEVMEAVLGVEGADRLLLIVDNAVLAPTSNRYHLANRGRHPRLLVVVGTHCGADAGHQKPVQRVVAVGEDEAGGTLGSMVQGAAEAAAEGACPARQPEAPGPDLSAPAGDAVDVEALVEAALTRIMAAASDRPPAAAEIEGEGKSQERHQQMEGTGSEEDDGLEITGAREAHEVERGETGVADTARPKTGEVEMCRHWTKG